MLERSNQCVIRPGTMIPRYWRFGPIIEEIGTEIRIGGGSVAAVRFMFTGECALLRCYDGDGFVSKPRIEEWQSGSDNAQALLRDSAYLPEVIEGPNPGILYLRVIDEDVNTRQNYILELNGLKNEREKRVNDRVRAETSSGHRRKWV